MSTTPTRDDIATHVEQAVDELTEQQLNAVIDAVIDAAPLDTWTLVGLDWRSSVLDTDQFWEIVERVAENALPLPDLSAIADMIDATRARRTLVLIASVLGSRTEWDTSNLEWIAMVVNRAIPETVPAVDDPSESAIAFWREVQP